jgi:hypothetical protein
MIYLASLVQDYKKNSDEVFLWLLCTESSEIWYHILSSRVFRSKSRSHSSYGVRRQVLRRTWTDFVYQG